MADRRFWAEAGIDNSGDAATGRERPISAMRGSQLLQREWCFHPQGHSHRCRKNVAFARGQAVLLAWELPKKRRRTEVLASINWQPGAVGRHEIIFDYIDVNWDAESAGIRRSAYFAKPASQQSGRMP